MKASLHNYFFEVDDGKQIIVYNPLSGSIDIGSKEDLSILQNQENLNDDSEGLIQYLTERGFIHDDENKDDILLKEAYNEYHEQLLQCPIKFTISLTYDCNARCPYCYIGENLGTEGLVKPEMVDKAFEFIEHISNQRDPSCPKHITLFGGDPLINIPEQRKVVEKILRMSQERGYEVDAVTNGYDLCDFADMLKKYGVKIIQVTFQGLMSYHNKHRIAIDKKGDGFTRLVAGVEALLERNIEVNCRILLDKNNISELPEIVTFFKSKGWLENELFRTHIGTVFDTFGCMPDAVAMETLSWKEANDQLLAMARKDRSLVDEIGLDWRGMKRFMKTGKLFEPNFKHCVAGINAFALDCRGDLYVCQVSLGQPDFKVGSYFPKLDLNERFERLQDRSILTVDKCKTCPQSLLCGGGCPIIGWLKHGSMFNEGCVNLKDTMQYGFDYYWPEIKAKMEGTPNNSMDCCGEQNTNGLIQIKTSASTNYCSNKTANNDLIKIIRKTPEIPCVVDEQF